MSNKLKDLQKAIDILNKPSKHIQCVHTSDNGMNFFNYSSDLVRAFELSIEALENKITNINLQEQGLLPKYHLGDEFWINYCGTISKAKIVMLQQRKDKTWKYRFCDEYSHTMDYEENDLGTYFFLTKEDVENYHK